MARQGRPRKSPDGKISPNRVAWLETFIGNLALMMYPEGYRDDDPTLVNAIKSEPGPTVRFMLKVPSRPYPIYQTLTALTLEELDSMKELIDMGFDLARPIVEQRDRAAQDAYDNEGDDSFARLYRAVPRLVIREGAIAANSTSLRQGPGDVPPGDRPGADPDGGVSGDGDELVDGEPPTGGAKDD